MTEGHNKGKQLSGILSNQWCYRVGTYRILAEIQDERMIILAVSIGHRREIYRSTT
ncbi:MAG: type II toxin-antitoxin system RelE/ParE family toxin [Proteobacteria bacterium]|nr:type II toxin-antitoxin system RelE/ParE family toxin [Pseudomonadota bacterium]